LQPGALLPLTSGRHRNSQMVLNNVVIIDFSKRRAARPADVFDWKGKVERKAREFSGMPQEPIDTITHLRKPTLVDKR
jgi:hypothetical protein